MIVVVQVLNIDPEARAAINDIRTSSGSSGMPDLGTGQLASGSVLSGGAKGLASGSSDEAMVGSLDAERYQRSLQQLTGESIDSGTASSVVDKGASGGSFCLPLLLTSVSTTLHVVTCVLRVSQCLFAPLL